MKIDFGCGASKKEGFIGVDLLNLENVDVQHDLSQFPYPFDDDVADEIWLDQVVEHISNPMRVMEEVYRICKNDALVTVGVPYFRSFYSIIDPTHVNFFGVQWFDYFDPQSPLNQRYQYSSAKFRVENIQFDREFTNKSFFHRHLVRFAEKRTKFYEAKLSHIFPLNSLTFHLRVLK